MNLENVAYLVNEELTTVIGAFGDFDGADQYTYICTKDLAKELEVGGHMVVERHTEGNCGMTVLRVVEVHEESEVDPDMDDYAYRWVVDKVEGSVGFLKDKHQETVKELKQMRRKSYRQTLIDAYKEGKLLESS